MNILAINPGSTSTKIATYNDLNCTWQQTIRHSAEELKVYKQIADQFDFRKSLILRTLQEAGIDTHFDAVIGRGGLIRPLEGGVYEINEKMKQDMLHAKRSHASNLGGLIAAEMAALTLGCRAFIADPVVVDELMPQARISGMKELPRLSIFHALNQKAIARRYAQERGKHYENLNLVVCHLGGGISVAAHRQGCVIDVNNALDGEGPFSPERAGTLPAGQLIDLCFSGEFTREEMKKKISGRAGLISHLGTTDIVSITQAIEEGDEHARLILDAMIYGVAKQVGAMCVTLCGQAEAIVLTGGIAYSNYVVNKLRQQVEFLAPVVVYPGEDELEALAANALGALNGELTIKQY